MNCCTKEELIAFEEEVIEKWKAGKIRSPVHLSGSINGEQEDALIEIFKEIKPQDWVFTTYRSHYHALLKGMPKEELMRWILENKSIHLMSKKYKIVTSAIVGGTLSQAVGCAMAIKREKEEGIITVDLNAKLSKEDRKNGAIGRRVDDPHVWAFCGDMTASLGVFRDCQRYALYNDLPITFVIEDNGLSTDTPTHQAWGARDGEFLMPFKTEYRRIYEQPDNKIMYYRYQRRYPHYGFEGSREVKFT